MLSPLALALSFLLATHCPEAQGLAVEAGTVRSAAATRPQGPEQPWPQPWARLHICPTNNNRLALGIICVNMCSISKRQKQTSSGLI
jgi:hypothetical protein